ncbi:hypothetical protein KHA94_22340 [Bacillus sp. FJAT-49705]|uniref:Uncharacterized protein n=1 Tax=Cytobacillus citreus TaxID=2833586 RepID=A0ABS5NYG5_9BACI|nr:hypothetical protein [Cytobacillus citreus]MBS4192872.1 hypothetical protein [Cytobacillus citreus]
MELNKISVFSKSQMINQARRIIKWVSENKQEIREFGMFFVNGIMKHEPSSKILIPQAELKKIAEDARKEKQEKNQYTGKVPFYNWLES